MKLKWGRKGLFTKQTVVLEGKQARLKPPPLYLVLMHNDDYTTMDFVVEVLAAGFFQALARSSIGYHVEYS